MSPTVEVVSPRRLDRSDPAEDLSAHFRRVRARSEALAAPLSAEDCAVQSMPDASPTKWHLAHTTWFFETFVLERQRPDFEPYHDSFRVLFNSYYNSIGEQHPRPQRGMLTRPGLDEVLGYRAHVDRLLLDLLEGESASAEIGTVVEIGLHHERQHQELLLTDVKHAFSCNPLRPAYRADLPAPPSHEVAPKRWLRCPSGIRSIGHEGASFHFDNETPRHDVLLREAELGPRPVTNGEFLDFMRDGGYERPELWLSEGWDRRLHAGWTAPGYWEQRDGAWQLLSLGGLRSVEPSEPVCHVSYFEADAFARWAGARLPTEVEWEVVAAAQPIEGNFVETGWLHPAPASRPDATQLFGDVWEWTASQYLPYPGYCPPQGALGEYNGKFMCNQFVLRGGSCATPRDQIRASYRNFFPPEARWQFSGFRLARDV